MKDQTNRLDIAILIAVNAHLGQMDKSGKPYILHPLHLMNQLMYDAELAIIGVLHDVTEDSYMTTNDLKLYDFSDRVISALILLEHKKGQSYESYIEAICQNKDAITVKRKDLEHNSDITRLKGITNKDLERTKKYHKAFTRLGEARKQFL